MKDVEALMQEAGVTCIILYSGAITKDKWECDKWSATFQRGKAHVSFDYFTGLGLRKSSKPTPEHVSRRPNTLDAIKWKAAFLLPVNPKVLDILYSLHSDSEAASQTFTEWCENYGYDTDSRKALALYDECLRQYGKFSEVFTLREREEMVKFFEDY